MRGDNHHATAGPDASQRPRRLPLSWLWFLRRRRSSAWHAGGSPQPRGHEDELRVVLLATEELELELREHGRFWLVRLGLARCDGCGRRVYLRSIGGIVSREETLVLTCRRLECRGSLVGLVSGD
jgi:hypothetical protein